MRRFTSWQSTVTFGSVNWHLVNLCLQVFDVVREQITRALQYQPTQLDQFRTKLGHLSYQEIINFRHAEQVAKERDELLATPIQYVNVLPPSLQPTVCFYCGQRCLRDTAVWGRCAFLQQLTVVIGWFDEGEAQFKYVSKFMFTQWSRQPKPEHWA